jgi:hypothetical protein
VSSRVGLAWTLAIASVVLCAASSLLVLLSLTTPLPAGSLWLRGANAVTALFFCAAGLLVVVRGGGHPVGWGSLLSGSLLASIVFLTEYSIYALGPGDRDLGGLIAARLREVLWPMFALAVSLTFLRFPTGRLPSRRWVPVAIVVVAVDVLDALVRAALPGPMPFGYGATDVIGITAMERPLAAVDDLLVWLVRLALPVVAVSLVVRYRAGSGELRQQLKWSWRRGCSQAY